MTAAPHSPVPPGARIRDLGYSPGRFKPGPNNSILDVPGVCVGQVTVHKEPDIHTGLTVILPRGPKDTATVPCYAAHHNLNGLGELTGAHAFNEWGFINTAIAITNSVSVGKVYDGVFRWHMDSLKANGSDNDIENLRKFCIPVVAETYDGLLNDISASVIGYDDVISAIKAAASQPAVLEGNHGGGTAMRCHGYKGGTGTSSRIIPPAEQEKEFTLGVLVQANHGTQRDLRIGNVPVGELLVRKHAAVTQPEREALPQAGKAAEGSIVVVIITDAPLLPHQLRRVAQHAGMGITQVGGHSAGRNFSGEIFLALSTGTSPDEMAKNYTYQDLPDIEYQTVQTVKNETMDSLFYAISEATEEAILNALCGAETLQGYRGRISHALPLDEVKDLLDKYMVL